MFILVRQETNRISRPEYMFYEKFGLCDEDYGKLDNTWRVRGQKDKKRRPRQQWHKVDKVIYTPISIWVKF